MAMGARRAFSEKMIGKERQRWEQLPLLSPQPFPAIEKLTPVAAGV